MSIHQYPPKQPKLVQTHVGQFFEFSKNHQFWFWFFEEKFKIGELLLSIISKTFET
jgi:hypothetical protein